MWRCVFSLLAPKGLTRAETRTGIISARGGFSMLGLADGHKSRSTEPWSGRHEPTRYHRSGLFLRPYESNFRSNTP